MSRSGAGWGEERSAISQNVADPLGGSKSDVVNRTHAVELLARATGAGKVRHYSTYDFGRAKDERCASVVVPEEEAEALVFLLRNELESGLVAFVGTSRWLGDEEHEGVEVVVGPGESQFAILQLARSDAVNYGMGTAEIAAKLKEYDEAFGIDIRRAETDTIAFDLLGWPRDLAAFAGAVYEFCPDIVDQGVGSVEELREAIEATGRVYLWWD